MRRSVDRILAISDIHAENKKFLNLLKKSFYNPELDLLVVCGDMVDRGEENLDIIATCMSLQKQGAIFLKGNHEQFAEVSLIEMITTDIWRSKPSENLHNWINHNGGGAMYYEIKDLSKQKLQELLTFIQNLPLYYENGNFIFTHAGVNRSKKIENHTEDELVWGNSIFPYCPAYKDKVVIFGHIPTWKFFQYDFKFKNKNARIWFDPVNKDKVGIDCGGVFGGRLAALELPSYRVFYE